MTTRRILVRVALAAVLVAILVLVREWLTTEKIVLHNDFFQYWSANRFILAGGNPYDHEAFAAYQLFLGWDGSTHIYTWNPPWALGLFLPFALMRYAPALLAWIAVQGVLVVTCTIVAWRHIGGGRDGESGLVFMALLFPPTMLTIWFGQLSGWLLVGVVLALLGVSGRRGWLVGLAAVLLSVKPHFVFLLLAGLGVRALRRTPWSTAAGVLTGLGITLFVPLLHRPELLADYARTVTRSQPREFVADTLGAGLRLLAGWEHFWVQFLPLLAGLVWLGLEMRRMGGRRGPAPDLIPLLALVSALVAPYGWIFDNVVAIPALAVVWSWLSGPTHEAERRRFVWGFLLFVVLLTALHLWLWHPLRWVHGWLPAFLLAVYLRYRERHVGPWRPGDLAVLAAVPGGDGGGGGGDGERPAAL